MTTEPLPPNGGSDAIAPNDVLAQAFGWFDAGQGAAVVTVIRTWSSAPMRPGSMMAVDGTGRRIGSVSNGVVDDEIAVAAVAAIGEGLPRRCGARVEDAAAQRAGLPCGGDIEVRIDPLIGATAAADGPPAAPGYAAALHDVRAAIDGRRGVVLCTRLADSHRMLIGVDDPADTPLAAEAVRAAAADSTRVVDIEGESVLLQVFNPPLRLFIVGAVHIAQALVAAARAIGFEVTVIDPRPGYATAQRFPGTGLMAEDPALALRMAALDQRSAVVTLSHEASIDDPAIIKALHSKAFYVGALGSRKTHKARLKRLHDDAKLPERVTARLHGPAGLAIGAIGPAEIAASIVAEIVRALRVGPVAPLSEALRDE